MSDPFEPSAITLKPATKTGGKVRIFLSGASGSGKTLSALLIARGLVGPNGRIGVIDTEMRRSRWHADKVKFDVADMTAPFSPARYIEFLDACERAGCDAVVIDTGSHEHEGTGGLLEMAETGAVKSDFAKWAFPKAQHKKWMNRLTQSPCHILVCFRARERFAQVPDPERLGKKKIVSTGWYGVHEKDMAYDATISVMMMPREAGQAVGDRTVIKCDDQFLHLFEKPGWLGIETGEAIARWLEDNTVIDRERDVVRAAAEDASQQGVEALHAYWKGLNRGQRLALQDEMPGLKSAAEAVDAERKRAAEMNDPRDPFPREVAPTVRVPDDFWDRQSYELPVLFNNTEDWIEMIAGCARAAPNDDCLEKLRQDNAAEARKLSPAGMTALEMALRPTRTE